MRPSQLLVFVAIILSTPAIASEEQYECVATLRDFLRPNEHGSVTEEYQSLPVRVSLIKDIFRESFTPLELHSPDGQGSRESKKVYVGLLDLRKWRPAQHEIRVAFYTDFSLLSGTGPAHGGSKARVGDAALNAWMSIDAADEISLPRSSGIEVDCKLL